MKNLSDGTKIDVLDSQGAETVITFEQFCERLGVDGWIRLHFEDYAALADLNSEFVHLNLEATSNVTGHPYAVVPILRPGKRRADGTEQLPVVDIRRSRLAVCVEVIQRLPVEAVSAEQFAHSLPSIRSADGLQRALIARYSAMFPNCTPEAPISRGCALTRLQFVDRPSN